MTSRIRPWEAEWRTTPGDHRKLILVKHAESIVEPRVALDRWALSERGGRQSVALADRLRRYSPAALVASEEPKAARTGAIVAECLRIVAATLPELHEHDRTGAPFFGAQAEFERAARMFFENPGNLVWGNETADEAQGRFAGAMDRLLARHPAGT